MILSLETSYQMNYIFSFFYSSIIEVTEEPTKPTLVQRELECLNDEIIKNLLDEDLLVKPAGTRSSMPTVSSPGSGTPTYASSEEDANFTGTYYNGAML